MPSSRFLWATVNAISTNMPAAARLVATAPMEPMKVNVLFCDSRGFLREPAGA